MAAGDAAIVILPRILREQRTRLPRGVTVRGRLSGLNRGATTAWVGAGRAAGLETGDRWLIWRGRIPIAYGQAVLLDDDTTLLELTSIVRDLRPEDGDRAALAPSPFERATQRRSVRRSTFSSAGRSKSIGRYWHSE
ncbi:MAG: hypothetical protein IH863_08480 [Chloroflexi bacterium]|nr:hypothetical protein [Chloroflexota bacterium]